MFSYNGGNLPRLSTYAEALRFFEQAKTWRGQTSDTDERKLDGTKRYVTIHKLSDGSIACRLHRTDVITYHPDTTITVRPWRSRSTDEFFNSLMRYTHGLSSHFTRGVIQVGERFYRANNTLKIALQTLEMVTQTEPYRFARINRARAKAARDLYNYKDFSAYAGMMEKMGVTPPPRAERKYFCTAEDRLACLQNREDWPHLLVAANRATWDAVPTEASLTLADVRDAIYAVHRDVYDETEEPYLKSWDEVSRWKRNQVTRNNP